MNGFSDLIIALIGFLIGVSIFVIPIWIVLHFVIKYW